MLYGLYEIIRMYEWTRGYSGVRVIWLLYLTVITHMTLHMHYVYIARLDYCRTSAMFEV